MTRYSKPVLSWLLWTWGGATYFMLEVVYKTLTGHPEKISWTMLVVAFILCIPVERCGDELPWSCPLLVQAAICTVLVTLTEFVAGLIINVWLGMGVWDYSDLWGNLLGQICPQYTAIWFILCTVFIVVFDYLRYAVAGGEKPHYTFVATNA